METENNELREAAERAVAAAKALIERIAAALDDLLNDYLEGAAEALARLVREIAGKIAAERSREDVKRQPVRGFGRPQPPKKKRPRIFRCRNSC